MVALARLLRQACFFVVAPLLALLQACNNATGGGFGVLVVGTLEVVKVQG